MSSKMLVQPSGHCCEIEARETVLHAGLRSGLNLDHGCATGTCGECRARLLKGDLSLIQHHDFKLSEQQKRENQFLMCCHLALSDIEIEAHESGSSLEIPYQEIQVRISKIEFLQEDVALVQVRTPRSQVLHFLAGQSISLQLPGLEEEVIAIASCPCDGMTLRFHVRRDGTEFSGAIFGGLSKGQQLQIAGPSGQFTLNEESSRPLIFVAWESGFSHIESLIDHVIQQDEDREIHLYWLSGLPAGHYLSNYCRAWVDALDNFHYHSIDLHPVGEWTIQSVLEQILEDHVPLHRWDLYLTLPTDALAIAAELFDQVALPDEQLRVTEILHS